jgi:hypothetical protein
MRCGRPPAARRLAGCCWRAASRWWVRPASSRVRPCSARSARRCWRACRRAWTARRVMVATRCWRGCWFSSNTAPVTRGPSSSICSRPRARPHCLAWEAPAGRANLGFSSRNARTRSGRVPRVGTAAVHCRSGRPAPSLNLRGAVWRLWWGRLGRPRALRSAWQIGQWRLAPPCRLSCRSRARVTPGQVRASRKPMPAWVMTSISRAARPARCSASRRSRSSAQCWSDREFVGASGRLMLALSLFREGARSARGLP